MKRKKRICLVLLLCLLLQVSGMAGCSLSGSEKESGAAFSEAGGGEKESGEYDLTSGQWAMGQEASESAEPWATVNCWGNYMLELPESGMTASRRCDAADDSFYYILERYTAFGAVGPGCQKYYLTRLDKETLAAEREELKPQGAAEGGGTELEKLAQELAKDLDENWMIITGMSVCEGRLCLLVLQMDREEKSPSHDYIVWLDTDRKVESARDVLPQMQQAGMVQDNVIPTGIIYDRKQYYYIGTEDGLYDIGVFDKDGQFLKCVEDPRGATGTIVSRFCLPNGQPVFECTSSGQTAIFYLEDLKEKMLYNGKCETAYVRYANKLGEVLYAGGLGIMRWDVETGRQERIYRDASLDPWQYEAIWETEDGGVTVVSFDGRLTFAQRLQSEAEAEIRTVTLLQVYDDPFLQTCAAEYSRLHPGIRIEVQKLDTSEGYDAAFQRLSAQLASGEGPDMFVLKRKQLEILQSAGALAELDGIWPEEIMEQIFTGVLDAGEIAGTLYGMATRCAVSTMAVSKKLWQKETWDYTDVISLMEANKAPDGKLQCILGGHSSAKLLEVLAILSINAKNSSLMDEEAGKCYFNTEEFAALLELCKTYGMEYGSGSRFNNEEILAHSFGGDLRGFSMIMADLGEEYQCVGYPVKEGYRGFVECYSLVAVSSKTENREIAGDFLRYLLSDWTQREAANASVRRDILCNSVVEYMPQEEGPVVMYGYGITPLASKPDGSTFLPEYLEILERSSFLPQWNETIGGIILEEAQAYFDGDKTAEAAAAIIQNRLQLYLNEK